LALLAAAVYGFIQVIPFGTIADVAGISGVPRTLSLDIFATRLSAIHYVALFFFLSVLLVLLDSASRIRRLAGVITVFGFVYAFFAILQSVLSPTKIYGIYEATSPFGSFVNRHNYAAFMEMAVAVPMGLIFTGAIVKDKRLLYITAIALMGVSLLLSGSRGGLIAFLAEIIFLVLLTTGTKSRSNLALKLSLAVLLFVAVIAGAVFVGGETSLTRVADTGNVRRPDDRAKQYLECNAGRHQVEPSVRCGLRCIRRRLHAARFDERSRTSRAIAQRLSSGFS
jgi:hypothetical protein